MAVFLLEPDVVSIRRRLRGKLLDPLGIRAQEQRSRVGLGYCYDPWNYGDVNGGFVSGKRLGKPEGGIEDR